MPDAAPAAETNVSLKPYNSFALPAVARRLLRVKGDEDLRRALADPALAALPKRVLGGGSNIVLTRDLQELVLKVEIMGRRIVARGEDAVIVEAGGGEDWHGFVGWTLAQGLAGLENLALIPGSVGAAPVQNIGAYGVELKDRFESLDAIDLATGRGFTLAADACRFGYRDSIFKHAGPDGLAERCLITRVRFRLPQPPRAVLGYLDIERKIAETGITHPSPQQVYDWVCAIRRAKLPDPKHIGNAGSFFKNPVVTPEQCRDIIARDPSVVHYPMADGSFKLAAGWLIDACGWKGKSIGQAGVYEKQALVLVNRGQAIGGEIVTLARAIQESVYGRFGIRLEPEPVVCETNQETAMTQWHGKKEADEVYSPEEIEARLKAELPQWYYEDGWIRRKYKTSGWKATLMVVNTVGHLAEAAWHHPDLAVSYAFVIVKLVNHNAKGVTEKDFALAKKIEEVVQWQPGKDEGAVLEGTPNDDPRFKYLKYD